jgi:beta-phosphoglucomutase-like phosphatase (HAD superfamily)
VQHPDSMLFICRRFSRQSSGCIWTEASGVSMKSAVAAAMAVLLLVAAAAPLAEAQALRAPRPKAGKRAN